MQHPQATNADRSVAAVCWNEMAEDTEVTLHGETHKRVVWQRHFQPRTSCDEGATRIRHWSVACADLHTIQRGGLPIVCPILGQLSSSTGCRIGRLNRYDSTRSGGPGVNMAKCLPEPWGTCGLCTATSDWILKCLFRTSYELYDGTNIRS